MAVGRCANCGHSPGKAFGVQHTTGYFQCKKCGQKFCSQCKRTGPACPSCGGTSIRTLGQLGRDY